MEMGCGKTLVAIQHLKRLYNTGKIPIELPSLVVCPNIVTENWLNEIKKFGSDKMAKATRVLTGSKDKRIEKLKDTDAKIFIINYQGLLVLKNELGQKQWGAVILDEIHSIANPKAQQAKICIDLSMKSRYRFGLSGTPIRNSYLDLYNVFLFLNQGREFGISFFSFRNKYFYDKNASWRGGTKYFPEWRVREAMIPDLQNRVARNSFRVLKEDCLDLPDKTYEIRYCDLTPEQRKAYDQLRRELVTQVDGGTITAGNALVKGLRLTQITSGVVGDVSGETHEISCGKLAALKETLGEIDLSKDKVIVFGIFRDELLMLQREIEAIGHKTALVIGGENNEESIRRFTEDGTVKVLVANERVSLGWNGTVANYVIYFSSTYSSVDRKQSEDRAHRIGQSKRVTYIDIVTRGTIDENVLDALKAKSDMAKAILDAVRGSYVPTI